jgi:rhodanese-related sulfurtransferase
VARLLLDRGFRNVRPLEGGFDAWLAAGLPTEPLGEAESALHSPVS